MLIFPFKVCVFWSLFVSSWRFLMYAYSGFESLSFHAIQLRSREWRSVAEFSVTTIFVSTFRDSCGWILCSVSNYNHPHFFNRLFIDFHIRMNRPFLDIRLSIYTSLVLQIFQLASKILLFVWCYKRGWKLWSTDRCQKI